METTDRHNILGRISVWALSGILLLAVLGLLSYLPGLRTLGSVRAGYIPMAPSTAVCFIGLALVLIVLNVRPPARAGSVFYSVTALLITAFGLLEALEPLTGRDISFEDILFPSAGYLNGIPVGKMSPATGAGFVLSGLAVLLLLSRKKISPRFLGLSGIMGILTFVTGFIYALTYLYGQPLMYGQGPTVPMALTTAAGFILLGIAVTGLADGLKAPFLLGALFLCLTAGIITVGHLSYRSYARNYRAEAEQHLHAVAELKVNELVRWRRERQGDGEVLHNNPAFSGLVRRFLDHPEDTDTQHQLRIWLEKVRNGYEYSRVSLLDAQGNGKLSVPPGSDQVDYPADHAAGILRSGQVTFMDFHRHTPDGPVYLSVQVPVYDADDTNRPLGVCVLQVDPSVYLYPFIQEWPVPSASAETLLVRREGDQIVFVNQLRFNTNPVLTVRSPITNTNLPAVQAVLGREGVFEGRDYRGKPVYSALHPVPGSPWFMVARRDIAEVFEPVKERLR